MARGRGGDRDGIAGRQNRNGRPTPPAESTRTRGTTGDDGASNLRARQERPDSSRPARTSASLRAQRNPRVAGGRRNATTAASTSQEAQAIPRSDPAIGPRPSAREERQAARRRGAAHRALAALTALPESLTADALSEPERFLVDFAAAHELPVQSPGAVVRSGRVRRTSFYAGRDPRTGKLIHAPRAINVGRRLWLSLPDRERLRLVILEMGSTLNGKRPEKWTPKQRAAWCLSPTGISVADLEEIEAVATTVSDGLASPERALARHRARVPLEDVHHRSPKSGPDPHMLDKSDRQLVRLERLNETAFAQPQQTAEWMVRWVFYRPGRRHPRFTKTVSWIRQELDTLAAEAARRLRDEAIAYRDSFFRPIDAHRCPIPEGRFEFWMYGYGEVPDATTEARVAEQARGLPRKRIDHVRVALAGDAEAVHWALRDGGTAALRWPWILRVLDGWRSAAEGPKGTDSDAATERLEAIGTALANIKGRGPVARPDRDSNLYEAVQLAFSFLHSYLTSPSTPIPQRLLQLGDSAHEEWNKRKRTVLEKRRDRYVRLDDRAIMAAAREMATRKRTPLTAARRLVAKAYMLHPESVRRRTHGLGKETS